MSTSEPISIGTSLRWTDSSPSWFGLGRPDWQAEGACLGSDPELFFPGRGEKVDDAIAVCRSCPVRAECLEYALEHNDDGVWGGTSVRERRRIRRERGVAPRLRDQSVASDRKRDMAIALREAGFKGPEIAIELGCDLRSVYRYLNEAS